MVYVNVYFSVDVLTHPNSLQWKAYSLKYANGEFIVYDIHTQPFHHTLSLSHPLHVYIVWMPSIANTDPQLFCKRFQFYLGDMDYVSTIILFLHAYMYIHALALVIFSLHSMYTYITCTVLFRQCYGVYICMSIIMHVNSSIFLLFATRI